MTTYTRSLSSDFGGSVLLRQLHNEISNSSIVTSLDGINMTNDTIDIVFDSSLTSSEETTLNSLISAHTPDTNPPRSQFFILTPKKQIKSTTYSLVTNFKFPGSGNIGPIDYIEIIAINDPSIKSFDARIVETSTGNVLCEKTGMTADVYTYYDLGTISNVPVNESILELHVKRNGGGRPHVVEIESLMIYYNN